MHSPRLNWLLAQLPEPDYERLLPHLQLVGLETGKQLFCSDQKETDIFFPTTCTVSAQIEMAHGKSTDIYLLGNRVFFGCSNNQRSCLFKAIVRQAGFAYRCPRSVYMREYVRSEEFMKIALIDMRIKMEAMATNLSCRTFHATDQLVARWLLSYGQGSCISTIHITHAELANALGARRERVTLALNQAARQGCLRLQRGRIIVLDYPLLQKLACNCSTEFTVNNAADQPALPTLSTF